MKKLELAESPYLFESSYFFSFLNSWNLLSLSLMRRETFIRNRSITRRRASRARDRWRNLCDVTQSQQMTSSEANLHLPDFEPTPPSTAHPLYDYNNYIPTIYFFSIYASSSCCICVKILTLLKSFYAPAKSRILLRLRSMQRRWAAVLTSHHANSILYSTLDLNNMFYYRVSSQLLKFMLFFRQGQTCCFSKWKEKLFF